MTIINAQKQTRSQGWGKPCRQRYALVPVRCEQACRDRLPLGFRPLFDVDPPLRLAGLRLGLFSHSSFVGRNSPCEGDRPDSPLPVCGLVATNSSAGRARVIRPAAVAMHLQVAHHAFHGLAERVARRTGGDDE